MTMTDAELLERALSIATGGFFYVEARVGSDNHRGDCCKAISCGGRFNDKAEHLIREFAIRYAMSEIPS